MTLRAAPNLIAPLYPESTKIRALGVFHDSRITVYVNGTATSESEYQMSHWYDIGRPLSVGDVVTMSQSDGETAGPINKIGLAVIPSPESLSTPVAGFPYSDASHLILVHSIQPGAQLSIYEEFDHLNESMLLAQVPIDHTPMAVELTYNPIVNSTLRFQQTIGSKSSLRGASSRILPRIRSLAVDGEFAPLPMLISGNIMEVGSQQVGIVRGIQGAGSLVDQDGFRSAFLGTDNYEIVTLGRPLTDGDVSLINHVSYRPNLRAMGGKPLSGMPSERKELYSEPTVITPVPWTRRIPAPVALPYCTRYGELLFTFDPFDIVVVGMTVEIWRSSAGDDWERVLIHPIHDLSRVSVPVRDEHVDGFKIRARLTIGDQVGPWSDPVVAGPRRGSTSPAWTDVMTADDGKTTVFAGQRWLTLQKLTPGSRVSISTSEGQRLCNLVPVFRETEHFLVEAMPVFEYGKEREIQLIAEIHYCDSDAPLTIPGPWLVHPTRWGHWVQTKRLLVRDSYLRLENCPPGMWCQVIADVVDGNGIRPVQAVAEARSRSMSIFLGGLAAPNREVTVIMGFGGETENRKLLPELGHAQVEVIPGSAQVSEVRQVVVTAVDPVEPERNRDLWFTCELSVGGAQRGSGRVTFEGFRFPDQTGNVTGTLTFEKYHPATFSIPVRPAPAPPPPPPPQALRSVRFQTPVADPNTGIFEVAYRLTGTGFTPGGSSTLKARSRRVEQSGDGLVFPEHTDDLASISVDGDGSFTATGIVRILAWADLVNVTTGASSRVVVNTGLMFVFSLDGLNIAENITFNDDVTRNY